MIDMRTNLAKHTRAFGVLLAWLLVLVLVVELLG
jgi:hypothetical protein